MDALYEDFDLLKYLVQFVESRHPYPKRFFFFLFIRDSLDYDRTTDSTLRRLLISNEFDKAQYYISLVKKYELLVKGDFRLGIWESTVDFARDLIGEEKSEEAIKSRTKMFNLIKDAFEEQIQR